MRSGSRRARRANPLSSSLTYTHALCANHACAPAADLSKVSSKLASDSKTFKWGAKKLNYLDALSKFFPCLAIVAFVGLLYVWRFYFF